MNLGEKWKAALRASAVTNDLNRQAKEADEEERTARRIIEAVPAMLDRAAREGEANVVLSAGWVPGVATALGDTEILARQLRETKRPLRLDDLRPGTWPYLVVEWCERNGLVCTLVGEKVPLNDHEYTLHASPAG